MAPDHISRGGVSVHHPPVSEGRSDEAMIATRVVGLYSGWTSELLVRIPMIRCRGSKSVWTLVCFRGAYEALPRFVRKCRPVSTKSTHLVTTTNEQLFGFSGCGQTGGLAIQTGVQSPQVGSDGCPLSPSRIILVHKDPSACTKRTTAATSVVAQRRKRCQERRWPALVRTQERAAQSPSPGERMTAVPRSYASVPAIVRFAKWR